MAIKLEVHVRDLGLDKLEREILSTGKQAVDVGITGSEASKVRDGGITMAELAQVHEFGLGVPKRSFLRSTFDENKESYEKILRQDMAHELAYRPNKSMSVMFRLGETARKDIIRKIEKGIPPPNAPSTIAAKGSDKPLVDTAAMRNSIRSKVKKL